MGTVDKLLGYIFLLSLVLIGVVYYVGVKTDANAFSAAANQLMLTATGRRADGTFAPYPAAS